MKRILSVLLTILFLLCFVTTSFAAALPENINAASVLLIDMSTGEVIYAENESAKVIPAGTTKLMTALVAYELCESPDESFEVAEEALEDITAWNDKTLEPMIQPGETVSPAASIISSAPERPSSIFRIFPSFIAISAKKGSFP
ncbi:MAG: hypothetical protein IJC91_07510, partial [Oscillospiraceae bacterium]|nr:hypothetical protein [Oscillospiraceae bacterium]